MSISLKRIENNLKAVRQNIADACSKSGRSVEDVTIIAVTKKVDSDVIRLLIDAGITQLAENQVQKLVLKHTEIEAYLARRRKPLHAPIRWHMVGHLQRNKVRDVVRCSAVVHSVDSLRLAETLSMRAEKNNEVVDVLLQVNCSQEPQKYGCAVGAATHLGEMIATLPGLRLNGLMTIGPLSGDQAEIQNSFCRLKELFNDMHKVGTGGQAFRHLSMGMSGDYTIAVEQGATMLRLGRVLFEED